MDWFHVINNIDWHNCRLLKNWFLSLILLIQYLWSIIQMYTPINIICCVWNLNKLNKLPNCPDNWNLEPVAHKGLFAFSLCDDTTMVYPRGFLLFTPHCQNCQFVILFFQLKISYFNVTNDEILSNHFLRKRTVFLPWNIELYITVCCVKKIYNSIFHGRNTVRYISLFYATNSILTLKFRVIYYFFT